MLAPAAGAFLPAAGKIPRVLNGIDVLREQNYAPLAGKRVGLITNHTGLAVDGVSTVDLLNKSGVCKLVALFSPEHGIRGTQDENIGSTVDEATGLPVYSLYGETNRPPAAALKQIDVLIYDIQDVGARFYTYSVTLAYCLEEAAKAKIPFLVLDRPNPIGGLAVEGPMLDADKTSFIGYMPLPVRHGMTMGEWARYVNMERRIGADLHVVEMKGWQRNFFFYDTGQVWVNPSPNMRNLMEAILYPGVCLLEATNVSVGRGTDRPFEIIGAPWIEPLRLAAELEKSRPVGVRFLPLFFTPAASTNQGLKCGGVQMVLTDPGKLNSVLVGLTLVSVLHRLYPGKFEVDRVIRLLGNAQALQMLKDGQAPAAVLQAGSAEVASFLTRRRKALIYRQLPNPKGGKR
jgi:uncharacterized protein YbbC (DUF1343 family)